MVSFTLILKMKIAVYGSALGGITDTLKQIARDVGRKIAERNHTIVTGACPGLPYEAVLGTKELRGKVIGFSPAVDLEEHIERFNFPYEEFDELIYIPQNFTYHNQKGACLKLRNVYSVAFSDAVICISGRFGTLNEFTIAYDLGKPIGLVSGTGGAVSQIPKLIKIFQKKSDSKIFYSESPQDLVSQLEQAV